MTVQVFLFVGIDCEKARSEEERLLTELSKRWYITKSLDAEIADEKTGATPLHVAAAKGYIKVRMLNKTMWLVDTNICKYVHNQTTVVMFAWVSTF